MKQRWQAARQRSDAMTAFIVPGGMFWVKLEVERYIGNYYDQSTEQWTPHRVMVGLSTTNLICGCCGDRVVVELHEDNLELLEAYMEQDPKDVTITPKWPHPSMED